MARLRQLFRRTRSENDTASHDESGSQSDTTSDKVYDDEVDQGKSPRQRNKLRRRSRSDETTDQLLPRPKPATKDETRTTVVTMSPAALGTLTPVPKDEEEARSNASRILVEQIDNQIAGRRTSSQARVAATSKTSPATAAKQSVGDQNGISLSRTRSQAKRAAETKSFSPPDPTRKEIAASMDKQTEHSTTFRLPYRARPDKRASEPEPPSRPVTDVRSRTAATAYLPMDQGRTGHTPPSSSSPGTADGSTPERPASGSSPATSAASSPNPTPTKEKSRPTNGPATCTYDGVTRTSLGVPYVPWVRWRCCECRHETHWEGRVCSKLDCSHEKCECCQKMAR